VGRKNSANWLATTRIGTVVDSLMGRSGRARASQLDIAATLAIKKQRQLRSRASFN